tara:strand:+ start:8477 stop:9289 length:813 start_codon:yes stop_codon:yes gene_type:complete
MVLDKLHNFDSNLVKRIITLIILIPIYSFCIVSDSFFSFLIIIVSSLFLSFEWYKITQSNYSILNNFFFSTIILINIILSIFLTLTFSILLTIFLTIFFHNKLIFKKLKFHDTKWLFYGFLFISIPIIFFIKIKEVDNGNIYLFWLFIIIIATDISSYLFGNLIKGPKIFPIISPSKTYSGTLIGIIVGIFFGTIFAYNFFNISNIPLIIFFTLIIVFFGICGDLFISLVKRNFKIKDSGNILPGHGGILDRYDSISFGIIILFFITFFL